MLGKDVYKRQVLFNRVLIKNAFSNWTSLKSTSFKLQLKKTTSFNLAPLKLVCFKLVLIKSTPFSVAFLKLQFVIFEAWYLTFSNLASL